MFFRQRANDDASISYFLGCAGHGKAVAIDVVAGDEGWFAEAARQAEVTITHVVDTHVHADHYSGGRALANAVGAPYGLHESNQTAVKYPIEPLRDGHVLEVGNVSIKVLHTPGHTSDSICLLVTDLRRGDAPGSSSLAIPCWSARSAVLIWLGASARWPACCTTACTRSFLCCRTTSRSSPAIRRAAPALRACRANRRRRSASRGAGIPRSHWIGQASSTT